MLATNHKPSFKNLIRFAVVSLMMFALSALAFASKGGGEKKKHHEFENSFTPINTASSFSLKKVPFYSGSAVTIQSQPNNRLSINAMITYQRGNTTFILPYQYKVNMGPSSNDGSRSNLQFLGVRIQIPK